MTPDPHGLLTAEPPHRPAKLTDCTDRALRELVSAAARGGEASRPASTPVAVLAESLTVEHTLTAADGTPGCPAAHHSAPCLCIRGQ